MELKCDSTPRRTKETFKMCGKLLIYQNILKMFVVSILAFFGLSYHKSNQKNEPMKAGERFEKSYF